MSEGVQQLLVTHLLSLIVVLWLGVLSRYLRLSIINVIEHFYLHSSELALLFLM